MTRLLIQTIVGRDILNRISAHDIFAAMRSLNSRNVVLDFKDVQFTTRSFMDEFYNEVQKAGREGYSVSLENMTHDLRLMYKAVSRTQNGGTREVTMKPCTHPKSLTDLEKIFSSMSI